MAVVLSDVVDLQIEQLMSAQHEALRTLRSFVANLEQHHFHTVNIDAGAQLTRLSLRVQSVTAEMEKYVLFRPALTEHIDSIDDILEDIGERFMHWLDRKTISVSEAVIMFGRSRSTIYRWIRSGKLQAQKENRRWVIAI